jgi:hypothetical protein
MAGVPMTLVPQLTPYTCCLACLESFFADISRPLPQAEMLKSCRRFLESPDPGKIHEYGALDDPRIIGLCTHLGFKAGLYQDFRQAEVEKAFADALAKNYGVLILAFWQKQTHHCVRLSQIKTPGLYEVMCPAFQQADFVEVTFPNLVSWGFRFITIS